MSEITEGKQLSPEDIVLCDRDIQVLHALSEYFKEKGAVFTLAGGYAVEAHCGGKITRPHFDIDGYIYNLANYDVDKEVGELEHRLQKVTGNSWQRKDSEDIYNLEIKEVIDGEPQMRGRLEVYVHEFPSHFVEKTLTDSQGRSWNFYVEDVNVEVAHKLRAFANFKEGMRITKDSDLYDFRRLVNHPDFDRQKTLDCGAEFYMFVERMPKDEAYQLTQKDLDATQKVTGFLESQY